MSKSQGNVLLVRNLLGEAPGEAIRLALLSTHYRNPLDWNESRLNQSRATLTRWYTSLARIEGETLPDWSEIEPDGDVLAALRDDLNVSRALKRLHELCYSLEQAALRHADLLVVGGTAITPNGSEQVDIASRDGRIVAIGSLQGQWSADSVLEAQGLHILPGVIDSQVHFREPGLTHKEDLEAGTRGAVLGGVTGVFEMPNTNPLTLWQADLQAKLTAAKGRAWCDYAFYIGGSGINAEQLQTLENLPGCAGVKVFMGSSFGDLLADDDTVLRRILRHGSRRMAVHAEDQARLKARKSIAEASGDICQHPKWRDVESAFLATQQIVTMAEDIGRRLHVLHVSTAEEMKYLARHKRRVTVEVTPHHLTMTAPECYQRLGSLAQMNPPVREQRHQEALWQAIREGVVDVIGSDHAPHTLEEKSKPYPQSPSGMTGVQTLLPVMLDHVHAGRLTLGRLVDLTSAGPARVFGIEGKGRIAVGYDADLTLVDLSAERTISNDWIASRSGWTPYDDKTVTGWPVHTVVRGKVMVRDETLIGAAEGRPIHFLETPDRRTNRA
ncbi:MAG: dihydroorotase [Alteromonadaceae bacterium]|nr:dihydroorotase [Alteromonadaceae bacterium]